MTKIAIAGSHGSGKTTFAEKLRTFLGASRAARVLPDIARLAHGPVGAVSTPGIQQWIVTTQLHLENLLHHSEQVLIYDGCSLSHLPYFGYWGGNISSILGEVIESARKFSRILWLPPRPEFLVADGVRPMDLAFQATIAARQLDFLRTTSIDFEALPVDWTDWSEHEWIECAQRCVAPAPTGTRSRNQHIVVIARVQRGSEFLFTRRRAPDLFEADGRWEFPGGKPMFGEHPARTAEREVLEETGYIVTATRPMRKVASNLWSHCDGREEHAIIICYKCELLFSTPLAIGEDAGVSECRWAPPNTFLAESLLHNMETFLVENDDD